MDLSPRRSLPRKHWVFAHRVVRVLAKIGAVQHREANWCAMQYARTIVAPMPWSQILPYIDDANYQQRARAAIA